MEAYLLDWANLLVRWLHLIAGIASAIAQCLSP